MVPSSRPCFQHTQLSIDNHVLPQVSLTSVPNTSQRYLNSDDIPISTMNGHSSRRLLSHQPHAGRNSGTRRRLRTSLKGRSINWKRGKTLSVLWPVKLDQGWWYSRCTGHSEKYIHPRKSSSSYPPHGLSCPIYPRVMDKQPSWVIRLSLCRSPPFLSTRNPSKISSER